MQFTDIYFFLSRLEKYLYYYYYYYCCWHIVNWTKLWLNHIYKRNSIWYYAYMRVLNHSMRRFFFTSSDHLVPPPVIVTVCVFFFSMTQTFLHLFSRSFYSIRIHRRIKKKKSCNYKYMARHIYKKTREKRKNTTAKSTHNIFVKNFRRWRESNFFVAFIIIIVE